jgi:predicted nucleic acid-binding protein
VSRVIWDTSVVLGPAVDASDDDVAISAVTMAELHYGVLVAATLETRAQRLLRLAVVERTFAPLPVDDAVARAYGPVAAQVASNGRRPRSRFADLLIAATALAHEAQLWTHNAADFAGLTSLVEVVVPS